MEILQLDSGERLPIPDAVIAASDNRDLVAEYVKATPDGRATIEAYATELLGGPPPKLAPSPVPVAPLPRVPVTDGPSIDDDDSN